MDILTVGLVAVFSLILGGLVVAVIFSLINGGRSASKSSAQSGKSTAVGTSKRPATQAADSNFAEVARLLRDRRTGLLVIDMSGKVKRGASELNAGEQHHLTLAARDLYTWLGIPASEPAAVPPVTSPQDQAAAPIAPADIVHPALQSASAAEAAYSVKPVKANLLDAYARTRTSGVLPIASQASAFKSITAQIDDILQRKLLEDPLGQKVSAAGRKICLSESLDGVVVEMGVDKYLGVDAVPDEDVRLLIRQAVAEWESAAKLRR
jgi:hypothetical protein